MREARQRGSAAGGPHMQGVRRDPVVRAGVEATVTVPRFASGELVPVGGETVDVDGQRRWAYRVEVERGLPVQPLDFADAVHATLADPRGWTAKGHVFKRIDGAAYDFRVILASPDLTDLLCAPMQTDGQVSCRNGDDVVLNALRWFTGAQSYGADLASYRQYLVNHEVGHRLGHRHANSPGEGRPAPVMMQQTLGLDGCEPNPWPLPTE